MQELFDDSTKRFKEQNEIITSIFHGFNSEIITIKEEIQSSHIHSQRKHSDFILTDECKSITHPNNRNADENHKLNKVECYPLDALEEVIEETSKECLTDNREEEKDSKSKPNNSRNRIISESEDDSNTHESNLNVPNERGVNVSEIFKKNINIEKDDSSEQLEIYFSCHDRMVNGSYLDDEETIQKQKEYKSVIDYSSIHDSREIVSMPELCRSTLMDQIDYDLDNYKLNESSMFTNSIDQSKPSIPDQQFLRAQKQTENCEDIKPKFMNFLNDIINLN